jgi:transposase
MGFVRGEDRQQNALFPLSLEEMVPSDHACRVIDAFVRHLPLAALGFGKATPKATGRPPYDPADLLKLYLYGYLHQVRSSRRLEQECGRNVEVMWLLGRLAPDHKTIAQFRKDHGEALKRAGAAFVRFCQGAGLVRGDWVAVDGSKFQAVASRKSVVWKRGLARRQAAVEQRIAMYLQSLDAADQSESEPSDRIDVRQALAVLQDEQQALTAMQAALGDASHRVASEPESRSMPGHGPGYNVQTAVDGAHALIVAHDVVNDAGDNRQLQSMGEAARDALQADRLDVLADAGYSNGAQAQALETQGIQPHVPANRSINTQGDGGLFDRSRFTYDVSTDTYRCPAGQALMRKQRIKQESMVVYATAKGACTACALKAGCTTSPRRHVTRHEYEDALQRMGERATPEAMRRRRCTVEHPFAGLKYRIFGHPRFLMRGIAGAKAEMAIATLAWNLKRAMKVLGEAELGRRLAAA